MNSQTIGGLLLTIFFSGIIIAFLKMRLLDKIKNFLKPDPKINSQQDDSLVLVRYRDEHMMNYYYFWISSNSTLVSPSFTSAADAEQWLSEHTGEDTHA